jgi:hypothetical protein
MPHFGQFTLFDAPMAATGELQRIGLAQKRGFAG